MRQTQTYGPLGAHGPTILLVDDDDDIRYLAEQVLEGQGYEVLSAGSGEEAMQVAARAPHDVDLLLTDVLMPRMDGHSLADRLHDRWPDLKVLYMSGYPGRFLAHDGVLEEGVELLPKPFSLDDLTGRVREVLDPGGA